MGRGPGNRTLRGIETLYTSGPIGGLTDAQLVDRFLNREGRDREDAFSALVHRHGPMVLAVCRRAIPGTADADDAFQAVFLVLARNARSVRRVDNLRSWLYGVAVRTAKEARRRSARLRAREGGLLIDPPAAPAADPDLFELRALLDEELGRLPSRYREPLMLCELEGASRQDAAQRLGLPEGTLSTRLARGRVLLRNRLVRRGVAVAGLAAIVPQPSRASTIGPLADAATRLALRFTSPNPTAGTIPAAVASLAEGVLSMIAAAKLKATLAAVSSVVVASCLTTGLAWGFIMQQAPKAEPKPAPPPAAASQPASNPALIEVRGVVVDEQGQPVAGAEVRLDAYLADEFRGETDRNGTFTTPPIAKEHIAGRSLLVRTADGRKVGHFRYGANRLPIRIVVRPVRQIVVRVADANQAGIPGAAVEVVAYDRRILDHVATNADGVAHVSVPTDLKVTWITAQKGEAGFDFAEFGKINAYGQPEGGAAVDDLPASIALTLDDPMTVRIKAVDADGKPAAGIDFSIRMLKKEGRRSRVVYPSREHQATTGADGIATFDWLPQSKGLLFLSTSKGYATRRVIVEDAQKEVPVARMVRTETIRGRVSLPDGSPAPGVLVLARGAGVTDVGYTFAYTAADGTYEMHVGPGEMYAVYIDDHTDDFVRRKDWTARTRLDVVVRRGKPVEGVDFQLGPGTIIKGTVTVGPDDRPAVGQFIAFNEKGERAPDDLYEKGDHVSHPTRRQRGATTDDQGRYEIRRVGPGEYTLMGPPGTKDEKVTVTNERELVLDLHMPRPTKGWLVGKVLRRSDAALIAGASVDFASASQSDVPFTIKTDAEGEFKTERPLHKTFLWGRNADGSLGAIVEIAAETPQVFIPETPQVFIPLTPTATATGVLLDEKGEIAANQELAWGRRIYLDEAQTAWRDVFAPKVVTDAQGRFTLPSLVVGQEYNIGVRRDDMISAAGVARPEKPGPLDLGTLRVGAYRSPTETSSFRPDAPDAGADAPPVDATTLDGAPLTLKDFAGKYVLLDFWATWCGPCLAEIPQLQQVYDAFGEDDRFAILSLSVDEKIDEPRAFQEKRKLPWSQGFLSGGLHGPKPGGFGVRAIPAFVLVGPDGKIVARGMRGAEIKKAVEAALEKAK